MSLDVRTFSPAFAALSNAVKMMDRSDRYIAPPLLGERAGVRADHFSSTTMKRCAPGRDVSEAFVRKGRADYLRWPDGEMVETGFVLKRMWAKHSGMWESQMP